MHVLKTNHVALVCAHLEILETFPWNNTRHYLVNKDILCKGYENLKFCKAIISKRSICEGIYTNNEMPGAKYKLYLINHRHETYCLSPEEATREDRLLHQLIIYLKNQQYSINNKIFDPIYISISKTLFTIS
jgi:hypothetical protein